MESRQPQKNRETEGLPEGRTPRPRRFRITKLEERIAPKSGGPNSKKCAITFQTCGPQTYEIECW